MNKAQKRVYEVQEIESIFTYVMTQIEYMNDMNRSYENDLQELLNEEDQDAWKIEITEQSIAELKIKIESYRKISEQLLKMM